MADTDQENISREAHERVKQENQSLKSKLTELEGVVKDMGLTEKARDFFKQKNAEDPDGLAKLALPHLRNVEVDSIGDTLDGLFKSVPLTAPTVPETSTDNGEPAEPKAPAAPTANPAPSIAGPNPSAPGETPNLPKLKITSPEVRDIIQKEGYAGVRRLDQEGRLEVPPGVREQTIAR